MIEPKNEEERRRAIGWAIELTKNTKLAPDQYEHALLEAYAKGSMPLDQVLHLLDNRVYHLLYRSKATHPFDEAQLTELLAQCQANNEVQAVTGLLCYGSDGYFVQVMEGSQVAVERIYGRIQQDARHSQLEIISRGAGPIRQFPDWSMALVRLSPTEFHWLVGYLEARNPAPFGPKLPIEEPLLRTLLQTFSTL